MSCQGTNKNGDDCSRNGLEKYGGNCWTHRNQAEGFEEEAPKAKATKKVSKPVEKDTDAPDMPAKAGTGDECDGTKKDGDQCTRKAFYTCDEDCETCEGASYCSQHWKTIHGVSANSGKKSDGNTCTGMTKAGHQCTRNAFGVDEDGEPKCSQHGGPKKSEAKGSAKKSKAGASSSAGPSNEFFIAMLDMAHGKVEEHADTVEGVEGNLDPRFMASEWVREVLNASLEGNKDVMAATLVMALDCGEEVFTDLFPHTSLWYLDEWLGRKNIQWLLDSLERYSKQETEYKDELVELWTAVKQDLNIKAVNPKSSTRQKKLEKKKIAAAALSSTKRKGASGALLAKLRAKQAQKAEPVEVKKPIADKGKEEEVEPEPMEVDEEELDIDF